VSFLAILSVACVIPARPSFSEWSLRVPPKVELRTPTTVYSAMHIRGGSAAVMNAGVMRSGSSYQLLRDEEVQPSTIHACSYLRRAKSFLGRAKRCALGMKMCALSSVKKKIYAAYLPLSKGARAFGQVLDRHKTTLRRAVSRPDLLEERGALQAGSKAVPKLSLVRPNFKPDETDNKDGKVEDAKRFKAFKGTGQTILSKDQVISAVPASNRFAMKHTSADGVASCWCHLRIKNADPPSGVAAMSDSALEGCRSSRRSAPARRCTN